MADKVISIKGIKTRGDSSSNLTTNNPTLLLNELCIEHLTNGKVRYKLGNGSTVWSSLPYLHNNYDFSDLALGISSLTVANAVNANTFSNTVSVNNSSIALGTTGTTISRNVADANTALTVNQINASSTGRLIDLQFGGVTKGYMSYGGNFHAQCVVCESGQLVIPIFHTPASSTETSGIGNIRIDENYIHVTTATDTWKRVPLLDWNTTLQTTTITDTGNYFTNDTINGALQEVGSELSGLATALEGLL